MEKVHFFQHILSFKLRKTHLLVFLNGFILAVLLYFYMEDNYENNLFRALAANVNSSVATDTIHTDKEEALLIQSLNLVYSLEKSRSLIFGNHNISSFKSNFIEPVSFDLMTGQRACGGFSMVLARLLTELDVPVRIPQMQVGKTSGGHIIVEAKTANGWVVLDPSFNLSFKKPDGKLASFDYVQQHWDAYKATVPSDYNPTYRYEGVRYTNWNKIPVLMPAIKNSLYMAWGREKTDNFSFRSVFLQKFSVLFNITLVLYLLTLFFSIKYIVKRNLKMAEMNPVRLFPKIRVAAKAV